MKEILIILLCVPLFVMNSFCDKFASTSEKMSDNLNYNACKFMIGSIILFPVFIIDKSPQFQTGAIICGIVCGLMYTVNKIVILRGYGISSVSFMTLCHAAGMLAPCILGHFFWNERITAISLTGVLVTVASIVILKNNSRGKKINGIGWLIGLIVFISSGGVMVLQKIMGIYFKDQSIVAYNFYSFVVPTIIMITIAFIKKEPVAKKYIKRKIVLPATGSAISLCVISLVMTKLAGSIPSALMFPLFNGTGIIAVCIGAIFIFKEKMTVKQIGAMFMSIIGMCLAAT